MGSLAELDWLQLVKYFVALDSLYAAGLALLGAVLLIFGGGFLFRFVMVPIGAFFGAYWLDGVLARLGLKLDFGVDLLGAASLGLSGFLTPRLTSMVVAGGIATMFVVQTVEAAPPSVVGYILIGIAALVGAVVYRPLAIGLSALGGAALLFLSLVSMLSTSIIEVKELAEAPAFAWSAVVLTALAGIAVQTRIRARKAREHREAVARKKTKEVPAGKKKESS